MTKTMRPRRFTWLALPLLPWAIHFVAIYSLQGLVCARGWSQPAGVAGMVGLTIIALVAIAWIGTHAWRALRRLGRDEHGRRFTMQVASMLSVLSWVAVLFTAMPLLWLPPCE